MIQNRSSDTISLQLFLRYYHRFLMFLYNYGCTLLDYTLVSQHLDRLHCLRYIIYFSDAVYRL